MTYKQRNSMDFFNTGFAVYGSPSRYIQGTGVLDLVGPCCATLASSAVLLCDKTVAGLIESAVAVSCREAGVSLTVLDFDGEIGATTGSKLAGKVDRISRPIIIAAGGGRTIDAGKALRDEIGSSLLTLPTVASNDSPTSKNYVLYDNDHRMIAVRHMPRNPDFVLVDTAIIAGSPQSFFQAGLGDAIAKKFEADRCFAAGGPTMFGARSTRLANAIANECYRQLILNAVAAYSVAGTGAPTEAFDAAVEAMILMAGLGFENGGLSIAHALTRGLSSVRGARKAPHGLQVAYGLLVQLELESNGYPDDLLALYHATGLPTSLRDLSLPDVSDEEFRMIAEPSAKAVHTANFERPITAQDLVVAMQAVEARFAKSDAGGIGFPDTPQSRTVRVKTHNIKGN
jgi:glycerol dehydrogenase